MIGLVFPIAGIVMLIGIILMALPVIRAAPWGCSPLFEAGLGVFLVGVAVALLGAIGWLICGASLFPCSAIRFRAADRMPALILLYLVGLAVNLIVLGLASFTPSKAGQRRRIWTFGLMGAVVWPAIVISLLLRHRAALKRFARTLKAP